MKIFNISDMSTPKLVQHGMVNQTFSIGGQLLKPGAYVTVDDAKKKTIGAQVRHLVKMGAVALDKPPANYKSPPPASATPLAPNTSTGKTAAAPAKVEKKAG